MRLNISHLVGFGIAAGILLIACPSHADISIGSATVSAQIASAANLSFTANTITFPSANPALTPSIAANENGMSITINARTGATGTVTLTVLAATDLLSGGDVIGINNVTWTATGSGFQGGTLNKVSAQTVGTWVGSGTRTGTLSFFLANSYTYPIGSYSATLTYTLTAL